MTDPERIAAVARCGTCRWWMGRVSGRIYSPGDCRRYPPSVVVRDRRDDLHQVWPTMSILDFCGEHQPKDHTNGTA